MSDIITDLSADGSVIRGLVQNDLLSTELGQDYHNLESQARERTLPVFSWSKGEPEVLGSGFILSGSGTHVFVTAAHVFDYAKLSKPLGLAMGQIALTGNVYLTKAPKEGRIFDSKDFGFIEIPDTLVRSLLQEKKYPVFVNDLKQSSNFPIASAIIGGYPETRSKLIYGTDTMRSTVFSISVTAGSLDPFRSRGFSHAANLFFQIGKKDSSNGRVIPMLHGISGGPIWGVPPIAEYLAGQRPQLIGITTGGTKDGRHLVGTRIYVILRSICKWIPAFREELGWVERRLEKEILDREIELEGLNITVVDEPRS